MYERLALCSHCSLHAIGDTLPYGNGFVLFHDRVGIPNDTVFGLHMAHDIMTTLKATSAEGRLHRQLHLWMYMTRLLIHYSEPLNRWYKMLNLYTAAEERRNTLGLIDTLERVRRFDEMAEGNTNALTLDMFAELMRGNKTDIQLTPLEVFNLLTLLRKVMSFPYDVFDRWDGLNGEGISRVMLITEAYVIACHLDTIHPGKWPGTRTFINMPSDEEITSMGGAMSDKFPVAVPNIIMDDSDNPFTDPSPTFFGDDDDDDNTIG